jgi:regulator of sirC expression with transglutaminase-like and TPR domain
MVWEHLNRVGSAAVPALREACEAADPRLRARARHALGVMALETIQHELEEFAQADDSDFDLEGAFVALSRIEYPELLRETVSARLDAIAEKIRPLLAEAVLPAERVRAMNIVLQDEMRFTGVRPDWNDLDSFAIHRVLERRSGVPITLSTIYLLVAQRLGIPLLGVGLPNHFLVRYDVPGPEMFIDPFYNGQTFTRRQCIQEYLGDYCRKDAYIQRVNGRDIAIRAVRGLTLIYSKREDRNRVRWLRRILETLQIRERTR